ncbi:MAG: hypothetical protein ACLFUW_00240 [Bacteroidales bacterium]
MRENWEFNTRPNIPVYDLPRNTYITAMPPVYIGGYQSYMTQSRENFFRITPHLNLLQESFATGDGTNAYTGTINQTPVIPGFKPNPPGAYSDSSVAGNDIPAESLKWNVLISASGTPDPTSGIPPDITLVDDGQGNLFDPEDTSTDPADARGSVDYITGDISITNFSANVPVGNEINVQSIPYQKSRPIQALFFQDQIILWPVPDQAYTVSFEVYKYPTAFTGSASEDPSLQAWWQLLAYGAADKIFADNGDFESLQKFRPLLDEQLNLALRKTIVQQTSERTATIYTETLNGNRQFPFGNFTNSF